MLIPLVVPKYSRWSTVILKYFSTTRVRAEWENMIDVVFDGGMPHGVIVIKKVTRRLASSEKK